MALKEWKAAIWGHTETTWAGHAWVTAQVPLVLVVPLRYWLDGGAGVAVYLGLVVGLCLFYVWREAKDEVWHREIGDYDTGVRLLTPRVDKVGDSLGPISAAITGLTLLAVYYRWWAALIPFALTTGAMVRAAVRTVRRARADQERKSKHPLEWRGSDTRPVDEREERY